MVQIGGAGSNNPDILSNIDGDVQCPHGSIWTNLTEEELKLCFPSGQYTIPHSGYNRCSLLKSVDFLVTRLVWTDIPFEIEMYNVGAMHSIVINPEIVNLAPGTYDIAYQIDWQSKKDVDFQGRIMMNGITLIEGLSTCLYSPKDDIDMCIGVENTIKIEESCYLTLQGWNGSAGNRLIKKAKTFWTVIRRF